jgi:phage-related protein
MDRKNRIPAVFYRNEHGTEPVLDWLRELPEEERRAVGFDLNRLQWRWPVGMPLARPLRDGLFELRSSLPTGRIARVLFFAERGELVIVHGFIKKTQKTPPEELELELELARRRMKRWENKHG